ncbi:MAG: hypothetical protein KME13_10000 [Myxacorys californica WJT36-NPBG1]|jgi:hypothetical protein|nr:hypothetical protein [Myxacorys californica WJT36-NPBG1]
MLLLKRATTINFKSSDRTFRLKAAIANLLSKRQLNNQFGISNQATLN